jgi:peptide-methionine (R)-S-oxide reductase
MEDQSLQGRTEAEWLELLGSERYRILRAKGTERPFTGTYNAHWQKGTYVCGACGQELFRSESKFDAHCGWPSFDRALAEDRIREIRDTSHGMIRTEILCSRCGSHLGHVFPDGPTDTGLRYCVNSLSLDFEGEG